MIQCRLQFNASCLKCKTVDKEMVRIAAIVMCKKCYKEEFSGIIEFDVESEIGKKYYKWLRVQKKLS